MKLFTTIFTFLLIGFSLEAQKAGLTFFSENGELFYVILDGIRQNNAAAANVKITDLDRPNYRAKIIFDDAEIKDINKNLFVYDVDGKPYETVYMIVKKKNGEMDLRMSSFSEAKEMTKKSPESVVQYHDKEIPNESKTTTAAKSPTNTTKEGNNVNIDALGTKVNVSENGESVNINMSLDGMKDLMKMDAGIQDGMTTTTTTTTTRTTTTRSNTNVSVPKIENPYETPPPAPAQPVAKGCTLPMSSSEFEKGKSSVAKQSFTESQMKTAKQMTRANCLSIKQIRAIMDIFSFEESKLEYAKFAYEYCTEKKNYYQLSDAFTFSSNADSLNDFLESQH